MFGFWYRNLYLGGVDEGRLIAHWSTNYPLYALRPAILVKRWICRCLFNGSWIGVYVYFKPGFIVGDNQSNLKRLHYEAHFTGYSANPSFSLQLRFWFSSCSAPRPTGKRLLAMDKGCAWTLTSLHLGTKSWPWLKVRLGYSILKHHVALTTRKTMVGR